MSTLIFWGVIIGIFFIGSYIEKRHYAAIEKRERTFQTPQILTSHISKLDDSRSVDDVRFVSSGVVIGADYFKHFLANLIHVLGGNLSPYESVLERVRREALLRLKEQASDFDVIINVKLETCMIGRTTKKSDAPKVSILAYGTAIKYK